MCFVFLMKTVGIKQFTCALKCLCVLLCRCPAYETTTNYKYSATISYKPFTVIAYNATFRFTSCTSCSILVIYTGEN